MDWKEESVQRYPCSDNRAERSEAGRAGVKECLVQGRIQYFYEKTRMK